MFGIRSAVVVWVFIRLGPDPEYSNYPFGNNPIRFDTFGIISVYLYFFRIFSHPNVLPVIGCSNSPPDLVVIRNNNIWCLSVGRLSVHHFFNSCDFSIIHCVRPLVRPSVVPLSILDSTSVMDVYITFFFI